MSLLDELLSSRNSGAIGQIARQFGIDETQVKDVIGQLAPVLGQGLARNTQSSSGLDALIGALRKGSHSRYLDDPSTLSRPETVSDGNGILGHVLGSKDLSRALATKTAAQTGVSADLIKQILPLIASLAMGALNKQTTNAPSGNQITDVLGSMLDRNGDGSALDDLLGMGGKFFRR